MAPHNPNTHFTGCIYSLSQMKQNPWASHSPRFDYCISSNLRIAYKTSLSLQQGVLTPEA